MQRIISTVYNLHTSEGPMQAAWGIGEDRRAVVCLPARRVRVEMEESRTAFLGTLGERAASVGGDMSKREERRKGARL